MQLQDIITAARDRHPAFHKTRVPNAVIGRYLGDYQNELIGRCVERDKQFLAQKAVVVLSLNGASAPGSVGAGAGDGLPGNVAPDGSFSAVPALSGSLVEALTTAAEGASVRVTERPATSATANDLTCNSVARVVNGDVGKVLVITEGKGIAQRRSVISNTATQWVISTGTDGRQWDTIPDATSLIMLVDPKYSSSLGVDVVTDLPSVLQQRGYLVRLDAQGVPYIDWTKPLVANVENGVALPTMLALLGGTVHYVDGDRMPLTIATQGRRFRPTAFPAVYTVGQTLFCCGERADWQDIVSLELDYVPIAPAFTLLTDLFLIADAARPALVAKAAAFMAVRVAGMPDVVIDAAPHLADGEKLEQWYLGSLRLTRRARTILFREGDY